MRWFLASSLAVSALGFALPINAQTGEVVQKTPSAAAVDALNRNLVLLARSPQDVNALLGAGQAALDLGDIQAANGFFTRANMVNPRLGKVKLGLAVVQIALKQPTDAAENFDEAAALGEQALGHLAERGLAYDLTGQQDKAQRDYQALLRTDPSNETARLRYAVSLGIAGKTADAERELEPALASSDREAWRMRAFVLAMNGRIADARKITQTVMPKGLSDALDPYMQRLPLLTAGQKASAAYFGEFPANVLKLAAPEPARAQPVQVAANTADTGKKSRRQSSREREKEREEQARQAAAQQQAAAVLPPSRPATPPPAQPSQNTQLAGNMATPPRTLTPSTSLTPPRTLTNAATPPPVAQPVRQPVLAPASSSPTARQPAPQAAPPTPTPTPRPSYEAPATVQYTPTNVPPARQGPSDPQGTSDLRGTGPVAAAPVTSAPTTSAPQPVPATAVPAPGFSPAAQPIAEKPLRSLADTLSTLDVPEQERQSGVAVADLSAVARIQAQRRKAAEAAAAKVKADAEAKAKADAAKKAEAERKAKLAANPSRNWVQIATGKDVDALAFDIRRLRRTYDDAIGDLSGWTAEWGATRRLLVGPFKKPDEAKAVVDKIKKSGGDAFLWQSEAGEEVSKIGGK